MATDAPSCDMCVLLPPALTLRIFSELPVDARALCACVRRGWRAALAGPEAWLRLDASAACGVRATLVVDAWVKGAAARARGQLCALDISGRNGGAEATEAVAAARRFDERAFYRPLLSTFAVQHVLQANHASLRELRMAGYVKPENIHSMGHGYETPATALTPANVLRGVPNLQTYHTDVTAAGDLVSGRELLAMLHNESFYAPLHVHEVNAYIRGSSADAVLDLLAAVQAHATVTRLHFNFPPLGTPELLHALVDTALARSLTHLGVFMGSLSPTSVPELARLLRESDALRELSISDSPGVPSPLLDAPTGELLADALRASTSLTSLRLCAVKLWSDIDAASAVLAALTGHPSITSIDLGFNHGGGDGLSDEARAAAGAALGALVGANAPALTALRLFGCDLGDAGLRPLCDALPHNSRLLTLEVENNDVTEDLIKKHLRLAVKECESLRELCVAEIEHVDDDEDDWERRRQDPANRAAKKLEKHVMKRTAAAAAAAAYAAETR